FTVNAGVRSAGGQKMWMAWAIQAAVPAAARAAAALVSAMAGSSARSRDTLLPAARCSASATATGRVVRGRARRGEGVSAVIGASGFAEPLINTIRIVA